MQTQNKNCVKAGLRKEPAAQAPALHFHGQLVGWFNHQARVANSGRDFKQCACTTVCPRSSDPFHIISYYIKWVALFLRHTVYVKK